MKVGELEQEYQRALRGTQHRDLAPLLTAGVSRQAIAIARPAIARVRVEGDFYAPDPEGELAYVLPVRVDNALTPEAADPAETLRTGSIVDLVAFDPAYSARWAMRRDTGVWLGAVEPQYLKPDPVPIWRSPLAWLKGECEGVCIVTGDAPAAFHVLTGCVGGLIAEDHDHATELRALLSRPWPMPRIILRKARHAA
jgi:hypothetical protein